MLLILPLAVLGPAAATAQEGPVVRFHLGSPELASAAYPGRYAEPGTLEDDIEWTADAAEGLIEWWDRQGPLFLRRAADLAGYAWPSDDIEVYLMRYWPTVSIEYPLVLALGAVRAGGRTVGVPEENDVRVLLLAHQTVHRLLDAPAFVGTAPPSPVRDHPFLAPGAFDLEAMVNWVTYTALEDLWGRERLDRASEDPLWRSYNPNHAYVVEGLMPRWELSRSRSLDRWLAAHPPGDEAFDTRDDYARRVEATNRPPGAPAAPEGMTGSGYGLSLGESYAGRVFVAYVDAGSPAARAGIGQGDVLETIEGRPFDDVTEAQRALDESWEENREINLSVRRGAEEVFLTIEGR